MPQLVQHSNSCIAVQCLEASWMISWINLSSFMWGLIRSCIGPAITSGNLQLVYLVSFSNSQPSSDMCTFSFPIVVKQCNNFVASSGSTHPSDICQLRDYIKKGVGNSRELLRERWTKKAAGFGGTCFGEVEFCWRFGWWHEVRCSDTASWHGLMEESVCFGNEPWQFDDKTFWSIWSFRSWPFYFCFFWVVTFDVLYCIMLYDLFSFSICRYSGQGVLKSFGWMN